MNDHHPTTNDRHAGRPANADVPGRPGRVRRNDRSPVGGFAADERGVSPVVGAVLVFGLVIALLSTLQTTAIPALNAELEFQHGERVEADVLALGATADRVAATGARESVVLETGLRYPPRMFFVNPPPVAGTVRTTDPGTVEVANARAAGEAGDYWTGAERRFETRSFVYAPAYNEYPNAPATVLEPGAVYDRFDGRTRALSDRSLVDGRRVTLVALDGRVAASARSVPVAVLPVSAPARTVTVRDDGDPVTLTVPTGLAEDEWAALLEDELDPAGDPANDRYVASIDCRRSPPDPCGRLAVTLEAGTTYELRLGKVSLGAGTADPGVTYLVDVAGDGTSVPEGGSRRLAIEVRDRFDNRVSGVTVDAAVEGAGTLRATDAVSGGGGRAAFVYEAPDDVDGSTDVTVTAGFGDAPRETVTFEVRVTDADGSGGRGGSGDAPTADVASVTSRPGDGNDRYDVSVDVTDPDGDLDRVEFELRDPDTGSVVDTAEAAVSGSADDATGQLRATGGDRRSEYRILVTAVDAAGNTGSDETTVTGSG